MNSRRATRNAARCSRPLRTVVFGLALALSALGVLAGCSGSRARALDLEAALARAKAEGDYTDTAARGNSLASFDVLTLASCVPDPWSIVEADANIEARASGRPGRLAGAISLATWEGTRVYIGDTHERAYASLIGGVGYWMLGQDDNAAALWRNALDIDKESEEKHRKDFSVAQYLMAKYYWNQPGQRDTARIYLNEALAHCRGNPYLEPERMEKDNVILLVETGWGPRKETAGPQGSMLVWAPGPSRGGQVSAEMDGAYVGRSAQVLDVMEQAEYSLRVTGKKALQIVKGAAVAAAVGYAVYRMTDNWVLAILAAVFLKLMPADTRQCWGLPAQVQLISLSAAPGKHKITLRCLSNSGDASSGQATNLNDVVVEPGRMTILLVRPIFSLNDRNAAPPPHALPKGIPAIEDCLARPGSPIYDFSFIDHDQFNNSPLYKFLPRSDEIEAPAEKAKAPAEANSPAAGNAPASAAPAAQAKTADSAPAKK